MNLPRGIRALRHRNFRLYYVGQGLSQIGTWLQLIATSWMVYKLSGSAFMLGLAAFALQIPYLFLAPVAGVLVDRMEKRHVLLATNSLAALQAFTMFALVASGTAQAWHFVLGNLLLGLVNATDAPARQSLLVDLVGGREDLPNAIALSSIMMNGARFIGPLVGGALIGTLGERWGFGLNACSYFVVLGALALMRVPPRAQPAQQAGWVSQLAAGARYAYGFLPSRCALLLLAATSITVGSYAALLPWFASEAFHGDSVTLGWLTSAAGLGAVSGMVYLAWRPDIRGLLGLIAWTSGTAGVALVAFSFSRSLWVALPALYVVGLGLMLSAASTNTVLQSIVPEDLRGRVAAFYVMSFIGCTPVGALLSGSIAEQAGPPVTLAACGVAALACALVYGRQLPGIRRAIRPVYEALGLRA